MTTPASKLLFIARDFPPDFSAGVPRIERFARHLPEFGWQPLILAVEHDPHSSAATGDPDLDALVVERCAVQGWRAARKANPSTAAEHKSDASAPGESSAAGDGGEGSQRQSPSLRRWFGKLKDLMLHTPDKGVAWVRPAVATGQRMIREHAPQAILTTGPPHSVHLIGRRLKQASGLPWIADFRDPWARRPWGLKNQNPWGQRLYPWLERRCLGVADRVILNTDAMADDFRRHYPEWEHKFLAIPNGCDAHLAAMIQQLLAETPDRAADAPLVLAHAGSLYRQRDPRPLIEAIALLNARGIRVRFEQIGNCSGEFKMSTFLRDGGYGDYASFTPPVPREEALQRLAAADLLLLIQPGTDLQIPGKLFEMLPFRKPILAITDAGATADLIERYHMGAVAADHRPEAIAAVLEQLISKQDQADAELHWDQAMHDFDGRTLTAELAAVLNTAAGLSPRGEMAEPPSESMTELTAAGSQRRSPTD